MAAETMFGKQFEALMAEVCRDFGAKLLKSWETDNGVPLDKEEVASFVEEAVVNFFKMKKPEPDVVDPVPPKKKRAPKGKAVAVASPVPPKKKGKAGKGGGGISRDYEAEITVEPPKKGKGKAGKGMGKPKCQALTAKGTSCSKCAVDGGPFCGVHMKSKETHKSKSSEKEKEKETEVVKETEAEVEYVMSEEEGDPSYELDEDDFDEDD